MRQPRLIFSRLGIVRPWSELEAELAQHLGEQYIQGMEELVVLTQAACTCTLLLLFPKMLILVKVNKPGMRANKEGQHHSNPAGSSDIGNMNESIDMLEAVEEALNKTFYQIIKPLNTIVYAFEDMKKINNEERIKNGNGPLSREIRFSDLKTVEISDNSKIMLQLQNHSGCIHSLPLGSAELGPNGIATLTNGLQKAMMHPDGIANWELLRNAIRDEQRDSRTAQSKLGVSEIHGVQKNVRSLGGLPMG